jgi:carbon monoxide dehydrogenase subunit G
MMHRSAGGKDGSTAMANGKSEISIDKDPDEIWKLIREFGALADYMPGVESCTVDGDVRTLEMMGITIKEQLREIDDDTRRLTYSVVESPMGNMQSHEATIAIDPEGSGSHVTWTVEVEPADLLPIFQGAYDNAVTALKTKFES